MHKNGQIEIPLHDIKPLVEIQEYSFYYLMALIAVGVVLFLGAGYLLFKFFKERKKFNLRKEYYKKFKAVNFKDAKKAAYELTKYGAVFKDDDERHLKAYENMLERLEKYKYKKDVEPFDGDTKHFIELYEAMIDV